jgi:hypothetical protein
MKISTLIFCFLCSFFQLNAQLNCKTKPASDGSTVKTCLHKNGKPSTTESWDKDQRFGKITGYNSVGTEIFSYGLRKIGGHASASVEYFPNGQVSKVYYSDAPDGGIQFYNSTRKFDETGIQTEFYETKYPDELEITFVESPNITTEEVPLEPNKEEPKPEVIECAVVFKNYFEIQNATSSKVTIKVNALQNNSVIGKSREIVLEPSQKLVFDTVFTAQIGLSDKIYALEVTSFSKKRRNKSVKLIEPGPIETTDSRTYYWLVVKE